MSDWEERHYEDATDEWGSPPSIWRPVKRALGGFDLDPCSGAESEPIATERYTASDDGLHERWHGRVWVNPPYSDVEPWLGKGLEETLAGDVETAVYLLPVRSSTKWWHHFVAEATACCLIEGRVSYVGGDVNDDKGGGHNAPFPSAIVVFGACPDALLDVLDRMGTVYHIGERHERRAQERLGGVSQ